MSQEITTQASNMISADLQEKLFIGGDLSKLKPEERLQYYAKLCESLNLNPLTRPFEYITFQGKMTLYARKDATEQLRKTNKISIDNIEYNIKNDIYIVTVYLSDSSGRKDIGTGAVNIAGLKGDALANAFMKAETKAKRRGTLSICGLGFLDETELETINELKPHNTRKTDDDNLITIQPIQSDEILNELIYKINDCASIEHLKNVFAIAYKSDNNQKFRDIIKQVYDVKKKEIEEKIKITTLEMFGGIDESIQNESKENKYASL